MKKPGTRIKELREEFANALAKNTVAIRDTVARNKRFFALMEVLQYDDGTAFWDRCLQLGAFGDLVVPPQTVKTEWDRMLTRLCWVI